MTLLTGTLQFFLIGDPGEDILDPLLLPRSPGTFSTVSAPSFTPTQARCSERAHFTCFLPPPPRPPPTLPASRPSPTPFPVPTGESAGGGQLSPRLLAL